MARAEQTRFWPLFDLAVRTPRLELRLVRDDEFADLIEVVDHGIHEPGTMPFFSAWTLTEPAQRARDSAQWWWRHRAEWTPDSWTFTGAVFVEGRPVGIQSVKAERFRSVRSVDTGSWLGRAYQGQGLGREMREAVLHLAFEGLGAEESLSGAFEDNAPSLATSRSLGYEENGASRAQRGNGTGRLVHFRLGREAWERQRRSDIDIVGLEGCLDMFVGSAD